MSSPQLGLLSERRSDRPLLIKQILGISSPWYTFNAHNKNTGLAKMEKRKERRRKKEISAEKPHSSPLFYTRLKAEDGENGGNDRKGATRRRRRSAFFKKKKVKWSGREGREELTTSSTIKAISRYCPLPLLPLPPFRIHRGNHSIQFLDSRALSLHATGWASRERGEGGGGG